MIKLKDLLKESSPGYENRQFGDPLPTLDDITKKYQEGKESVNESTDARDYNESAMDSLSADLNGAIYAWSKTDNIIENDKTYKIVLKWKKVIDKAVDNCDRELRKLK